MKVKVSDIKVGDRLRREVRNVDRLAESIREFGLLEPIVVDDALNLVAGERRLRAIEELGWEEVEVSKVSEVEEWRLKAMELEENLQRENLTYAEEVEAKLRIHELYVAKYGKTRGSINLPTGVIKGWGVDETAELLGESVGEVVQDLQLARAIRERPELAKKETKSAAFKAMKVGKELEVRREIAKVLEEDLAKQGKERLELRLGDARQVLGEYESETFDFCVTDPPYGVGIDGSRDFVRSWGEVRVRDVKSDLSVQEAVFREVYRVLREGSHCYVFFASMMWRETKEMLERVGFRVSPIPIIWVKSRVQNYDPYRFFSVSYEPIFYCWKGKAKAFTRPSPEDVIIHREHYEKSHPTQKPVEVYRYLIEVCSVEGERGLDPFVGSGTFLVAVKETGRLGVGIEIDESYYTEAWKRVWGEERRR